jgi:CRISPR-associated exonuclease Cas4
MHLHGISFAQWNRHVQIGTAQHDTSYARDRSTQGLFGLAPDRINWEHNIVYESKGTGGAVEAVSDQTAFYALLLSIATGRTWRAVTHVLSTRKRREVVLDEARMQQLWESSERLERLAQQTQVPSDKRIPLCASCSLAAFCGYD